MINIVILSHGRDPLRLIIRKNTLVKIVLEMCQKALNLPNDIASYVLFLYGIRCKGPNFDDDLQDNDDLNLVEYEVGC